MDFSDVNGPEDARRLRLQMLAETLSNLVGLVVTFKLDTWDEPRKLFKKSYVSKGIATVEMEFEPTPHVTFVFTDGTAKNFFSMSDFECLIGKFGEYGSIYEYLSCEASTLFR